VGIIDHGPKLSSREIYAHDFFGLLKKQYKNNFFTGGLAGMASVLTTPVPSQYLIVILALFCS
jgi:hypothetical protein